MEEMKVPGPGEWLKAQQKQSPELHLDESKMTDAAEELVDLHGPEDAVDEILSKLDENPGDQELIRQANLIANRFQGLSKRIRDRIQH